MLYRTEYPSPLGAVTLVCGEDALIGVWFAGQTHFMAGITGSPVLNTTHPVLQAAVRWLDAYFAGKRPSPAGLPLRPGGSPFRQKVYRILLSIPYGETMTYGEIARRLGGKMSAQAVGGAVGHNPISIIIPCHRVVGANGSLTGYDGGLERKEFLLRLENPHFGQN